MGMRERESCTLLWFLNGANVQGRWAVRIRRSKQNWLKIEQTLIGEGDIVVDDCSRLMTRGVNRTQMLIRSVSSSVWTTRSHVWCVKRFRDHYENTAGSGFECLTIISRQTPQVKWLWRWQRTPLIIVYFYSVYYYFILPDIYSDEMTMVINLLVF